MTRRSIRSSRTSLPRHQCKGHGGIAYLDTTAPLADTHSNSRRSRQRSKWGKRFDGRGQVGVGREKLEVRVVVENRRSVIFGDRGSEVIDGGNAQVLVRGAKLILQLDRSPFGTLADPQQWKLARVHRRRHTTGPCLE